MYTCYAVNTKARHCYVMKKCMRSTRIVQWSITCPHVSRAVVSISSSSNMSSCHIGYTINDKYSRTDSDKWISRPSIPYPSSYNAMETIHMDYLHAEQRFRIPRTLCRVCEISSGIMTLKKHSMCNLCGPIFRHTSTNDGLSHEKLKLNAKNPICSPTHLLTFQIADLFIKFWYSSMLILHHIVYL